MKNTSLSAAIQRQKSCSCHFPFKQQFSYLAGSEQKEFPQTNSKGICSKEHQQPKNYNHNIK